MIITRVRPIDVVRSMAVFTRLLHAATVIYVRLIRVPQRRDVYLRRRFATIIIRVPSIRAARSLAIVYLRPSIVMIPILVPPIRVPMACVFILSILATITILAQPMCALLEAFA